MKFKGISEENLNPKITLSYYLAPRLTFINDAKIKIRFDGTGLEQEKASFNTAATDMRYWEGVSSWGV